MRKNLIPTGPTLVELVGPAAAGKSEFAKQFSPDEAVSTDALRQEFAGDFRRQDRDDLVHAIFDQRICTRLEAGLRVVADATHIRDTDRRRTAKLAAKYGARVIYVVIDRPLTTKLKHAGWRENVYVNGKPLVIAHDDTFRANLNKILAGDSIAHVIDTRPGQVAPDIVMPLSRESEQGTIMDIHSRGFKGIIFIGDLHGNIPGLRKLLNYAVENDLFMIFLGDIVDYHPDTLRAAEIVSDLIFRGDAASIFGNHEKKDLKVVLSERSQGIFATDNPGFRGELSEGNAVTINQLKAMLPEDRLKWETRFIGMCEQMPHMIRLPRYLAVHGAANTRMLSTNEFRFAPDSTEESLACYGETTGKLVDGFPERIYDWVDEIPPRQTVVVGHECRQQTYPLVQAGKAGGRAVFLDTGSSKPDRFPDGRLSGMILDIVLKKKDGFVLENERFVTEHDL